MQNQQEIFRDEKVEAYRGDKHPFLFISYAHADTKEVQEILGIMKKITFASGMTKESGQEARGEMRLSGISTHVSSLW